MENNQNNSNEFPESQAAHLAVIAGLITTLGDGLATIAAALAIQEAQQSSQNDSSNNSNQKNLQKQIDDLSKEVKQIKKFLRTKGI
ncbi:MAG TPA: hypothetical protein VNQ57_08855 [Ureibacillus sp.]|nr:hypothetical protein [Ureibacillus sp.]